MSENFSQLFEESIEHFEVSPNSVIQGVILDIDSKWVTVHAGLKSEGLIPREQFLDEKGETDINIGDSIQVALITIENGYGQTLLSRELARRLETWSKLEDTFKNDEAISGTVTNKVKGGFSVDINCVKAFLPGSLADSAYSRDLDFLLGKQCDFKIIKIDKQRNNIVVSRRAMLQAADPEKREAMFAKFQPGNKIKGIVKNITEYGAFIDLGMIDGLLHVNDMSWKRVEDVSSVVKLGEEIEVSVLSFDKVKNRISLSLKELEKDPWNDIIANYKVGEKYEAKVIKVIDYGCFVGLEGGIEGLVHASEMSWTDKSPRPSSIVKIDSVIEVVVLDIDTDSRRISLGIKQCSPSPWINFAAQHKVGEKVQGSIVSITDFGIFVGLEDNINALIRMNDISWEETGANTDMMQQYKKGDSVEAIILSLDPDNERVSLGIKQLNVDVFSEYTSQHKRGSIVTGRVASVDKKSITVDLGDGVISIMNINDMSSVERVTEPALKFRIGDEVTAKIVSVSKAKRELLISIKSLEIDDEKQAISEHRKQVEEDSVSTSLGDLIKAQMNQAK